MTNEKKEYTMAFDRYEPTGSIHNKIHCRHVKTSDGVLLQDSLCLDKDIASKVIGHLTAGEIIIFSAELAFQNIEFKYPHGEMEEDREKDNE